VCDCECPLGWAWEFTPAVPANPNTTLTLTVTDTSHIFTAESIFFTMAPRKSKDRPTTRYQEKQRQEAERQPVASTSVATPGRSIKFLCWIHGISRDSISVDTEDSETVDDLKRVILLRTSSKLAGIDTDDLSLWKVSSFLHVDQLMPNCCAR
jgi:hypothetical protein